MTGRSKELLIAALERLAQPSADQRAYLTELRVSPSCDELALEFADALAGAQPQGDAGKWLTELDQLLESMSGAERASLWQLEALETAPEWAAVRHLASRALDAVRAK